MFDEILIMELNFKIKFVTVGIIYKINRQKCNVRVQTKLN